jgi:hypothetical protein
MTYCDHCGTDAQKELRRLRDAQQAMALEIREAIETAKSGGLSWSKIGDALGLARETLFRQFMSGGPINTVRVSHYKPKERA